MADEGVNATFALICQWAITQGATDLSRRSGLWEGRLADQFNIAINARREDHKTFDGLTVPPMHAAVNAPDYLGAIMLVGPYGGVGASGMEDEVIAALKGAIAAAGQEPWG